MTFIAGLAITALVVGILWLVSSIWFLKRELEDMSVNLETYKKNVIGYHKTGIHFTIKGVEYTTTNEKPLIKYVEDMNEYYKERIKKLEEYLQIKRIVKEEKIDKYVKVKK